MLTRTLPLALSKPVRQVHQTELEMAAYAAVSYFGVRALRTRKQHFSCISLGTSNCGLRSKTVTSSMFKSLVRRFSPAQLRVG